MPADFYQLDKLDADSMRAFAGGISREFSGRVQGVFIDPGKVPAFTPSTPES